MQVMCSRLGCPCPIRGAGCHAALKSVNIRALASLEDQLVAPVERGSRLALSTHSDVVEPP